MNRAGAADGRFYEALGSLLAHARFSSGLSLEEIGAGAGIDREKLQLIERGRPGACNVQQYYDIATELQLGPGHVLRMAAIIAGVLPGIYWQEDRT